jgi:hypothetical protein
MNNEKNSFHYSGYYHKYFRYNKETIRLIYTITVDLLGFAIFVIKPKCG